MVRIIESIAEIAADYDAAFVDLWGCMHNGVRAYDEAVAAMRGFRRGGGKVVLVTNAPRPRGAVARQLDQIGVPEDCWDVIATSGDSARAAMFRGVVGRKVWFMGDPDTDLSFFDPLKIARDPVEIERVELDEAEGIVCCGPFDSQEHPSALRPQLLAAKTRGLKLLCANPDIVVDRGDSREWCAGAIAALYTEMGGESLYFGKPHPPIYDLARQRLAGEGATVSDGRILCIGDGIRTDILGAQGEDLDSLFITGGLAAEETDTAPGGQPDPARLDAYLASEQVTPTFAIGFLR
ncbi:TIGR01459 family HAD-type hydrolase [Wenxinia marina]|uniref:HAD-superfamily class IIA hydrolase n=1 Tax=Wenxinia marina DSM 24838 TaxID=1123501 RepID=A0A0D0P8X1_9RHOB|nr:TIGR01459 family HAD-type hydrolase [Wenxinia marina]KIQ68021.1 HAD-superfamily class IIA hydrolase [Wenxinia marina DSM 24838]GGL75332.1 haloacid dehalogenase [Wenxinia marina]